MQLDEVADDRQPESEAAPRAVRGLTLLREHVEDVRQELAGDADAGVASPRSTISLALATRLDGDVAARVGVLGGVGQQVGDDLRQTPLVAVEAELGRGKADSR